MPPPWRRRLGGGPKGAAPIAGGRRRRVRPEEGAATGGGIEGAPQKHMEGGEGNNHSERGMRSEQGEREHGRESLNLSDYTNAHLQTTDITPT
eukprot:2208076-Pyramimonas_sp.AAC.1